MKKRDEADGTAQGRDGDSRDVEFERLFAYYEHVVSFLRGCGLGDDARDVAQEVYIRVYAHWSDYRGQARWNYLKQIARRLALNHIRDRHAGKRRGVEVSSEVLQDHEDKKAAAPDAFIEAEATRGRLAAAFEQLEPGQKICVERFYLQDRSYAEICEELNISSSALKSRLHAARNKLQHLLGEDLEGWPAEPERSGEDS